MAQQVTAGTLAAMRGWVDDCSWKDVDEGDAAELTQAELVAGVNAHYEGGLDQFVRDCGEG